MKHLITLIIVTSLQYGFLCDAQASENNECANAFLNFMGLNKNTFDLFPDRINVFFPNKSSPPVTCTRENRTYWCRLVVGKMFGRSYVNLKYETAYGPESIVIGDDGLEKGHKPKIYCASNPDSVLKIQTQSLVGQGEDSPMGIHHDSLTLIKTDKNELIINFNTTSAKLNLSDIKISPETPKHAYYSKPFIYACARKIWKKGALLTSAIQVMILSETEYKFYDSSMTPDFSDKIVHVISDDHTKPFPKEMMVDGKEHVVLGQNNDQLTCDLQK